MVHVADGATSAAKADLLIANTWLTNATVTASHTPGFGGGETLTTGVYSVGEASTFNGILTMNGTATDIFIFKINGSLSIAGSSEIVLTGGATACNVFWQVNGVISMAGGSKMKGTFISTNAAINMIGVTLEGRALTIIGAITVDGITARIPIGCGSPNPSPVLLGPDAPTLISSQCFVLFSSSGNVTNTVPTAGFTGDIGTNLGLTSGFVNVTGTVHTSNDASTAAYVPDLLNSYNYLNLLTKDIDLLFPQQLGNDLVLTPHVYLLSGAALFTGNLYLNAQGNSNAVFVIQVNGALSTSSGAKVILMYGALAKNVYWKVTGAVSIEISSEFKGTIVSTAAVDLKTLVLFEGRALTITGVITTAANSVSIPFVCTPTGITLLNDGNTKDR